MAMPTWGKVLIGCGGLVTALGLVALVALAVWVRDVPRTWTAEHTVTIDAEPAEIRNYLINPRRWSDWSAWTRDVDSEVQRTFTGPERGEGASMSWDDRPTTSIRISIPPSSSSGSNDSKAGRGRIEVGACTDDEVRWTTTFEDQFVVAGRGTATVRMQNNGADYVVPGVFRMTVTDTGTTVTWTEEVDLGSGFAAGLLAASMGRILQPMHEDLLRESLAELKRTVESR